MQERPAVNPNEGNSDGETVYDRVHATLQADRESFWQHFFQHRPAEKLDERLVDLYELRPEDLPELKLTDNLAFVEGFSYVASKWYLLIRAVATGKVTPSTEYFFNDHLAGMFKDARVTVDSLRQALAEDPSGVSWLEQRVRAEFRQENLSTLGSRKAIAGIRKLHEALDLAA